MKKLTIAFLLSYVLTLASLWIAHAIADRRDLQGTVILTQRFALSNSALLAADEESNGLPFSWLELSASRALRATIKSKLERIPIYRLRQQDKKLFLEVWEHPYFERGEELTKRLQEALPVIRTAILAAMKDRGVAAEPEGPITVENDASRLSDSTWRILPLVALVFVPGFAATVWLVRRKKNGPNQSLEPTPLLVTPAADAPVAPSKGVAHL